MKTSNQKKRLLYLLEFLFTNSDAEHRYSIEELIEYLAGKGIEAERKTLYDDFKILREFNYEINCVKDKHFRYYLDGRTFETAELKLLADAVASSKFISESKSKKLIKKIGTLSSVHEAKQLERAIVVTNRVKSMNERVYYNVDRLHRAITEGKIASFKYFDYTLSGKKNYRKNGERYMVSPFLLTWDNENYYLLCHYEPHGSRISPFRVDRMEAIEVESQNADRLDPSFNLADYSRQVFGMYVGKPEQIKLRFANELLNPVIDKFGKGIKAFPHDENSFHANVEISVSPNFFGWLMQFGDGACILSPDSVRKSFTDYLDGVRRLYD